MGEGEKEELGSWAPTSGLSSFAEEEPRATVGLGARSVL